MQSINKLLARIAILLTVSTSTVAFAAEPPPTDERIQPVIRWTGPQSKISENRFVRVRDPQQWKQVWLEHLGKSENQAFNDSDVQYHIDFDRYEVLALFQGNGWNSRGIRFLEISESAEEIRIRFEDISYQTSGINGGGVNVSAYAFVVFPRTAKSFRIEENIQGLKDHPAKWKPRALLKVQ